MAVEAVFADSAFLYALVDRRDSSHRRAVERLRSLVLGQRPLISTDYVVAEALTLAKSRAGSLAALRLMDRLDATVLVGIEWIGPDRFAAAKTFFRKHSDHDYSFTDCTSFVVMRELNLTDALTTDAHFVQAGFRALLRAD
jgi:predicted nucleic acid-binding protein